MFSILNNLNYKTSAKNFKMNYTDNKINFIPSFHTDIIINEWINYTNENKVPQYIINSLYDVKTFIAVNKYETNTILIAWCPKKYVGEKIKVSYIIVGKIINRIFYIERIAQNPIFIDLNINSKQLLIDLNNTINKNYIIKINYDKLYDYDKRYLLSFNY